MKLYESTKYIYIGFLLLLYFHYFDKNKYLKLKVCICTIGKKENKYALEFVEYYKKFGVDKIFIYDNNDVDGEKFDDVLRDYIKNGFVTVINVRGKLKMQYPSANDCYKMNKDKYNWFLIYDMDEFIHLNNYKNIKKYLGNKNFSKCNVIYLNQILHTDNEHIYYSNKSLFERFPNGTLNFRESLGISKIILRGNLTNINIYDPHRLANDYECISTGSKFNGSNKEIYNNYYYYDHFYFKSSEEYLEKLTRGDAVFGVVRGFNHYWLDFYFDINKITKEKLDFFENKTGLNFSKYRDKCVK